MTIGKAVAKSYGTHAPTAPASRPARALVLGAGSRRWSQVTG